MRAVARAIYCRVRVAEKAVRFRELVRFALLLESRQFLYEWVLAGWGWRLHARVGIIGA